MVELKSLTSPKVAIPVLGIVVLVVVSTLVALFYIRNPTVTDNIFGGPSNDDNSTTPFHGDSQNDHASSNQGNSGQQSHLVQSTTPGSGYHEQTSPTTTSAPSAATLPATTPADPASTPMHAIEPVQHL